MACVTRTYPDNTRTTSQMSGDTPPGQTRTYAFRHVQMSGVRTKGERRDHHTPWDHRALCRFVDQMHLSRMNEIVPGKKLKKERPLPRKISQAVEMLVSGEKKTITSAALALGLTREHLSKSLRTPEHRRLSNNGHEKFYRRRGWRRRRCC
jgi:hypothetical protein